MARTVIFLKKRSRCSSRLLPTSGHSRSRPLDRPANSKTSNANSPSLLMSSKTFDHTFLPLRHLHHRTLPTATAMTVIPPPPLLLLHHLHTTITTTATDHRRRHHRLHILFTFLSLKQKDRQTTMSLLSLTTETTSIST